MNEHSGLTSLLAIAILVVALGFLTMRLTGGGRRGGTQRSFYYYDLGSGKVFIESAQKFPPIEAPSGPLQIGDKQMDAGVRAFVFTCGECPDTLDGMTVDQIEQTGAKFGYVERYTDDMKKQMENPDGNMPPMPGMMMDNYGRLVATLPKKSGSYPKFYENMSAQGADITMKAMTKCPGGSYPKPCMPKK